jgi:hypothetical protein
MVKGLARQVGMLDFLKDLFFLYPVSSIQHLPASSNVLFIPPTRRFEAELS